MSKPIYKKAIDVRTKTGDLKKQVTFILSPWSFEADSEKGTPAFSGYTCKIGVLKLLGDKPSNNFIHIDPADDEVRNALKEMYASFDKLQK